MSYQIEAMTDLNERQKSEAIELFIEGFYDIIGKGVSKDRKVLLELFQQAFDPSLVLVCLEGEEVIGFLGMATKEKRPIQLDKEKCIALFGKFKGTMVYKTMGAILHERLNIEQQEGYIDYLTTAESHRGRGVATFMINWLAGKGTYRKLSLEVLAKNERAHRLYQQLGFRQTSIESNLMLRLNGYGQIIKMSWVCEA